MKSELEEFIKSNSGKLKRGEINYTEQGFINSIHRLAGFDSEFRGYFWKLLHSDRMLSLVKNFLRDDAQARKAECFAKPKQFGLESPWHQDNFYWGVKDANALTVWIALDHCNNQNGALSYITGSHKLGLLPHVDSHMPGSSQKIEQQTLEHLNLQDMIETPELFPGDILIHHSLMIHGSEKNLSESDRRGVTLQYKALNSNYDDSMVEHYYKRLSLQLK